MRELKYRQIIETQNGPMVGTNQVNGLLFTTVEAIDGHEICEGDILTGKHAPFVFGGVENYRGVVQWMSEGATFWITMHRISKAYAPPARSIPVSVSSVEEYQLEVAGNIQLTPELLERE